METAPLKSFATWARTTLIREVAARITAVLAPGSSERVEQAQAVAALEKAAASAGGGDKGRAAVADKVAYTWFNRIIALRFMDANGYTGIGVVSPQAGVEVGQPEILAEAKRGVIDTEVLSQMTRATVVGLLDGTRASGDPQGEAYALLLAGYCRYWNRAMPFMFEREGDYTELLVPANLLADDSVLNRSVKVLTKDVCKDVEVIGWLYQFYISERKDEVFAGFKKNKKAGADEIPAATQLFTPHWIVRYLVENSLGRLWMLNRPSSGLAGRMYYYIAPVDEETDFLKITKPEDLKVIDPACGSGHMLTFAFDLLYAIYEEEGYGPADIPGLILANNLYGAEIDPRAGSLAAFALTMKARAKQRTFFNKQVEPNICVIGSISFAPEELDFLARKNGDPDQDGYFWNQFKDADILGALIQPDQDTAAELVLHLETLDDGGDLLKADTLERARRVNKQAALLAYRYSILVANPPYMGNRNMSPNLSAYLSARQSDYKSDLFSAFVARSLELVADGAILGIMTPNVWMYISSHEQLRSLLLRKQLTTLVELPLNGFRGATVQICAFVVVNHSPHSGTSGTFIGLVGKPGGDVEMASLTRAAASDPSVDWSYQVPLAQFSRVPGSPVAYWLSERMFQIFEEATPLAEIAAVKHGLSTGRNAAVVRYWWEISRSDFGTGFESPAAASASGKKWFPYNKGGDYRRWYGNLEHVLRYDQFGIDLMASFSGHRHDGRSYYFREGITWTFISSAYFAARYAPLGSVFDVSGSSLFPRKPKVVLALMCSDLVSEFLQALNPTLNFQVGNIKAIPYLKEEISKIEEQVEVIANQAITLHIQDWDSYETAWDFAGPRSLGHAGSLSEIEDDTRDYWEGVAREVQELETRNNRLFRDAYGVADAEAHRPPRESLSLRRLSLEPESSMRELVSFSVGCMFGRYSLDAPGLILADQGATIHDYLAKIPTPSFAPDVDNAIPIVVGDWFEDDIVARFRRFLRVAFGDQHFEENLRFVTESLGVKNLRDYFVKSFYKDHVQRYKKRPIYWLFSSPKGSFNALIYMHRYTPSTVSTVLNEYLREFQAKLKANLEHAERSNSAAEADQLRKILLELEEYEHNVLYPLASQNIVIDLDDGVKANYPKFGDALKKIPGLEASE
jgi:hypothetical protein